MQPGYSGVIRLMKPEQEQMAASFHHSNTAYRWCVCNPPTYGRTPLLLQPPVYNLHLLKGQCTLPVDDRLLAGNMCEGTSGNRVKNEQQPFAVLILQEGEEGKTADAFNGIGSLSRLIVWKIPLCIPHAVGV